jgi:hypothetical protein
LGERHRRDMEPHDPNLAKRWAANGMRLSCAYELSLIRLIINSRLICVYDFLPGYDPILI